jgi:hypothetical protein
MKTVWQVLKILKIELLCDTAAPLLGTYPKEMKTESQSNCSIVHHHHLNKQARHGSHTCDPSYLGNVIG